MVVVSDGTFRRGEVVNLICREVGKFQLGKDGKHWFDIDMIIKGPSGAVVLDKKNLLGEEGHSKLENDIAESPYGIFETNVGMEPGAHQMILTIRDKISGAKVSVTKSFTLSSGLSYQDAVFARKGIDEKLVPVADRVFQRGEAVNLILLNAGKFKKGPDGKHWFDIDLEVKGPNGNVVFVQNNLLGENGRLFLENDIAESPYGIFYTNVKLDPGTYLMQLTIRDKIGNQKLTVAKPFTLK
jgi:hypothetical protein